MSCIWEVTVTRWRNASRRCNCKWIRGTFLVRRNVLLRIKWFLFQKKMWLRCLWCVFVLAMLCWCCDLISALRQIEQEEGEEGKTGEAGLSSRICTNKMNLVLLCMYLARPSYFSTHKSCNRVILRSRVRVAKPEQKVTCLDHHRINSKIA